MPEDLQMEILADLPSNYWYRYRSVCHDWNTILSSKYFLTDLCGGDDPPLLLICNSNIDLPASKYFYFHTWTWETTNISLPFLKELQENLVYEGNPRRGSAAGLILLDDMSGNADQSDSWVCNPYTHTFIKLPPTLDIMKIYHLCLVLNDINKKKNTYKVVAQYTHLYISPSIYITI